MTQVLTEAPWQENEGNQQFDLRITITEGGEYKMSSLQDSEYAEGASTPEEAKACFERLIGQGQHSE